MPTYQNAREHILTYQIPGVREVNQVAAGGTFEMDADLAESLFAPGDVTLVAQATPATPTPAAVPAWAAVVAPMAPAAAPDPTP